MVRDDPDALTGERLKVVVGEHLRARAHRRTLLLQGTPTQHRNEENTQEKVDSKDPPLRSKNDTGHARTAAHWLATISCSGKK
jgi:hypothetical protein